ncbi:hypothetical protein KIH86_11965 [Paenibacillus sp. HN-1]|uniref:hypothetical protein n=1 Tax=Paenibacillus TaxID=44249 RepID=UPI001CA8D4A2|nr:MULTISPECIES: hypothetical protein [Paenibacillus]MBY9081418.1 hypothetical protein [Paenibacillus sp. CGMCC 1.18879]MBY9084938.1 hypothetical protein [Paenibacillus sinensis]
MVLLIHSVNSERLERLSYDVQKVNEEARRSFYEMSAIRKPCGHGYEWEVTVYGRKVSVKSEDIFKLQKERLHLSVPEIFKEIVAWKLKTLTILES